MHLILNLLTGASTTQPFSKYLLGPSDVQPWIVIGRTDAEAEAPILCHLMRRADSLEKNPHAGKEWGQKEKEGTEDEVVGWHQRYNGHGFEQTLGDDEGQEAWCAAVPGVEKSETGLSDWTATVMSGYEARCEAWGKGETFGYLLLWLNN